MKCTAELTLFFGAAAVLHMALFAVAPATGTQSRDADGEPGLLVAFPQDGWQLQLLKLAVQQDLGRFCHVAPLVARHM